MENLERRVGWVQVPAAGLAAWIRTMIPKEDYKGVIPGPP